MKRIVPALVLITVLAAACGGGDGNTSVPDDSAMDPPVVDGDLDGAGSGSLADGTYFGFVLAVDADDRTITFDEAIWINDDDAPNGYRIEDVEPGSAELDVASTATFTVLTAAGDPSTESGVDMQEFAAWYSSADGAVSAFDILVEGGAVTNLSYRDRP